MSKYEIDVWEYADEFKNLDTNETFGGYAVCELLEQKDQQIAELKKQLKEKDVDIIALDTDNYSFKQQIDNLRQQLKSQPAEIVEKIKKRLRDRLNIIAGYGQMTIDEFSFFVESEFTKDIDDILKEYQK